MSLTFPRTDLMTAFQFVRPTSPFVLRSRQEFSTQANGIVRGKDFGSALWQCSFSTQPLNDGDAVTFEAMLNSLDGVIQVFEASDLRRPYPLAYSNGVFNDTGILNTVNANNKALSLRSLPTSFALSVGDYLAFDYGGARALHQVMEAVTANGSGLTSEFEVRPYIRHGYSTGVAVTLKNPRGQFTMLPDTISSTPSDALWTVNFQAIQYL